MCNKIISEFWLSPPDSRNNFLHIHNPQFQNRRIQPERHQPLAKSFHLQLPPGFGLLPPIASLIGGFRQQFEDAEHFLLLPPAAPDENLQHRIVRHKNVLWNHRPAGSVLGEVFERLLGNFLPRVHRVHPLIQFRLIVSVIRTVQVDNQSRHFETFLRAHFNDGLFDFRKTHGSKLNPTHRQSKASFFRAENKRSWNFRSGS